MENCPICSMMADATITNMDSTEFKCPRCGSFTITGTALAMLRARTPLAERDVARLSHSIRVLGKTSAGAIIDSTNVLELAGRKLPSLSNQIDNLLKWLADRAGDDHLCPVDLPNDYAELAGEFGATNGDRVLDLIRQAELVGLVQFHWQSEDGIQLTGEGWKRLEELKLPSEGSKSQLRGTRQDAVSDSTQLTQSPVTITRAPCPRCQGVRNASVRGEYRAEWHEGGMFSYDTYRILSCCGCDFVFFEHKNVFSEREGFMYNESTGQDEYTLEPITKHWPQPQKRNQPKWLTTLADSVLIRLFDEVYIAIQNDARTLAAMGTRTIVDRLLDLYGCNPADGFSMKIRTLHGQGKLSQRESDVLSALTDAGSAAAHRGWEPSAEELDDLVSITENLVHGLLSVPSTSSKLQASVPPKPKR